MILVNLFKLSTTTTVLLLLSSMGFADNMKPSENTQTNMNISNLHPHFELTLGALYLQPNANNLGWAATTTVLPIPTPNWKIHAIDPSYHPGFLLGARYFFPCENADLQLNWTHLKTSDTRHVSVDPATQWVSPFSQTGTPPTGGEITGVASLKTATGKVTFNYDVVNLDIGKFINLGSRVQVRLFSGLSGLHLSESLKTQFVGLPKVAFTLNNTSTYNGIGPRLGMSNMLHVYGGINLVMQFAGSLLVGQMQPAEYQFVGQGSDLALIGILKNRESISSSSVTQVVPGIDTKLAINYLLNMRQSILTFELGWMGAFYFNPLSSYETNTNVIALDTGSLSTSSVRHTQSNFSATGPFLTVSLAV